MNRSILSAVFFFAIAGQGLAADPFKYAASLDMNRFSANKSLNGSGGTYLKFMEEQVKPAMDKIATEGYTMCNSAAVGRAYQAAAKPVQAKVTRSFGGIANVQTIADKLVTKLGSKRVTLATLPNEIRAVAPRSDIYGLANFLGLACGGGVLIKHAEGNYSLNVHYDVKEQRSGRSYGVGPTRGANDASDKEYLTDLSKYSRTTTNRDLTEFYRTLMQLLLNTDGKNYSRVIPEGQTVLTDFIAVYTAEQARNLMDGNITLHWDAALLEVTLIAGFHAKQSEIKLYYRNPETGTTTFTNETLRQEPCKAPSQTQVARLSDYWQFSRNITDPKNCRRSGINITKGEFRKLGQKITEWVAENNPTVFARVAESMDASPSTKNLYEGLSKFLISNNAPRHLSAAKSKEVTEAWVAMLALVSKNADVITSEIETAE